MVASDPKKNNTPGAPSRKDEAPGAPENLMIAEMLASSKELEELDLDVLLGRRAIVAKCLSHIDRAIRQRGAAPKRGRRRGPATDKILVELKNGRRTVAALAAVAGHGTAACKKILQRLARAGDVTRVARGEYVLSEAAPELVAPQGSG